MTAPLQAGLGDVAFKGDRAADLALELAEALRETPLPLNIVLAGRGGPVALGGLPCLALVQSLKIVFMDHALCSAPQGEADTARQTVNGTEGHIWAERNAAFIPIPCHAIDWIEADRDYVRLHYGEEAAIRRATLSSMAAQLGTEAFLRVRRSALVRLSRIKAIRRHGAGDYRVELPTGHHIRVGRTYISRVRAALLSR